MAEATFPAIGNGRRLTADLRATRAGWASRHGDQKGDQKVKYHWMLP